MILQNSHNGFLDIRNGNVNDQHDGKTTIEILQDLLINNTNDQRASIVSSTYPSLLHQCHVLVEMKLIIIKPLQ